MRGPATGTVHTRALGAALCGVLVGVLSATPARADDRGDAAEHPADEDESAQDKKPAHTERNIVPVVGGDTDIGIGVGGVGSIARLVPGYKPYRWNFEASGLVTFKYQGRLQLPYQDLQIKLTIPEIAPHLRLVVNPGYNHERAYYYGMGNASTTTAPAYVTSDLDRTRYFQFERTHPTLASELRYTLHRHWYALFGGEYTQTWMNVHPGSKITDDQQTGGPEVQRLLGDAAKDSGVILASYGMQWDTRDSEINPTSGSFDEVRFRFSPGGLPGMPYRYTNIEIRSRLFIPLGTPKLVLASRWVIDLLTGHPPFYELARFEETNAVGGPFGVRGVPAQRYYGKIKVFGGFELRGEVARMRLFDKPMILGLVGFFDAGRVWSDFSPHPELDGDGVGIKYGVGTGIRVRSGHTFVLRGDVAWSPDATPIGAYLGAGHAF